MNKIVYAALLIGLTATAVSAQTSDQLATDIQAVDSAIGNINAALKQVTADAPNYLDTYQAVLGSSSNQTEAYATYQFCQGPNNNQNCPAFVTAYQALEAAVKNLPSDATVTGYVGSVNTLVNAINTDADYQSLMALGTANTGLLALADQANQNLATAQAKMGPELTKKGAAKAPAKR